MPEPTELSEADFDSQLRGLFQEAELKIQGRGTATAPAPKADVEVEAPKPPTDDQRAAKAYVTLPQMLRPMVQGLEAISRATGDNSHALQRLEKAWSESLPGSEALPRLVQTLETLTEQKNSVSLRMFDALHEELRRYKDDFLLESILKPIIRDLISLYDDMATIHAQTAECLGGLEGPAREALTTIETNIGHHCEFVCEVLSRLEVTMMPVGEGLLDKHLQRAVAVEYTSAREEDHQVVRTLKRGFFWKDRVIRAEEVLMKRWKDDGSSNHGSSALQK